MKQAKILGVRIDNLTKKEILEKIEFFLSEKKFHLLATVNPEFILEAQKNKKFGDILNNADLCVADGVGIKYAFLRFGKWLKCRMTGVDLMHEILKMANGKKLTVFLAVNRDGLSRYDMLKDALEKEYPEVRFNGADIALDGKKLSVIGNLSADYRLQITDNEVVFCNFGAPNQEIFLNQFKNDNIQVAMGVGGSFDFVTGKVCRSPKILQKMGLEWLWRMMVQPWRWRRIFNAVIVFPIKIIFSKKT